jgi:hypothetical protein
MPRPTKAAGSLLALVLAAACAGDGRDAAEADAEASATASSGGTSGAVEPSGAAVRDGAKTQIDAAVAGLVEDAARTRAELDFGALPPWSARAGADPWALLQDGGRTLGLTRRGAVVVLDEDARVLRRVPTVVGASAIVRVGGELRKGGSTSQIRTGTGCSRCIGP